jgi:quercetin dioxygenase-like cupin family protein
MQLARTPPANLVPGVLSPTQIVHQGDVIKCLPGVEHWHGASPGSGFAYIAVTPTQKGKTIWLEPVSDKDYSSVK